MRVKALIGFGGAFSMYKGEVKECNNNVILQDLLKAGYVEEVRELETITDDIILSRLKELSKNELEIVSDSKVDVSEVALKLNQELNSIVEEEEDKEPPKRGRKKDGEKA